MNHAPRLNLSCIKMHVTRKSVNHVPWLNHSCYEGIANHVSEFIIRATSCTLRGNRESRTVVESFMQQVARYGEIVNRVQWLIHSCIEMHATRELVNRIPRLNLSCIKMHVTRKSVNRVSGLNHSCNKLHATFEMNNALDG